MPKISYNTSNPLYGILRRSADAYVWNGISFESWNDSNLSSYVLTVTSLGGDMYSVTMPSGISSGQYDIFFYERAGASPSLSDSFQVKTIYWSGLAESVSVDTSDADSFFSSRLHSETWFANSQQNRAKALAQADEIINQFAYIGVKAVADQLNEWPRTFGCYTNFTPPGILIARYLIAYALLDGVDPEREIRNNNVVSRGYSAVRTTYDTTVTRQHIVEGVPSAVAWSYLSPYFQKAGDIRLHRVS